MGRLETLTDVPTEAVDEVVSDFESEGAFVALKRQPNGAWTVVAAFGSGEDEELVPGRAPGKSGEMEGHSVPGHR